MEVTEKERNEDNIKTGFKETKWQLLVVVGLIFHLVPHCCGLNYACEKNVLVLIGV